MEMTMVKLLMLIFGASLVQAASLDFEGWLSLHGKSYSSTDEHNLRFQIWLENKGTVARHNAAFNEGFTLYTMAMESPFADMTADEFSSLYLMEAQQCSATTHISLGRLRPQDAIDKISKTVDWRTKGIMTPVKNQGHCGSCWTFSASGCLEAHTCLAHRAHDDSFDCTKWHGLAEQQLVDCAGDFNNFGCKGGLPSQAFEYIKYNGGIDLEDSYQYEAQDGACKAKYGTVGAEVAGVYNITSRDEDDLVHAIETLGPVSIAYQVSPDFRLYQNGIYDSFNATSNTTMCNNTNMDVNHAVVAVGLGQTAVAGNGDDDVPFYIVRNSWGISWGMEGHFWMKRGENLCGVSDCASFPLVSATKDETMEGGVAASLLRGASIPSLPIDVELTGLSIPVAQ